MKSHVIVATESRFFRVNGDRIVCSDGTYGYRFWQRYLDVFPSVTVVARVSDATLPGRTETVADVTGPGVRVHAIRNSHGLRGAVQAWWTWQQQLIPLLLSSDETSWILRLPGQVGGLLARLLHRREIPFGVEVVGDPGSVFSASACRHPLRRMLRSYFCRQLRFACTQASAAAYVTSCFLQEKYPPAASAFTTDYSSVDLPDEAFVMHPRIYRDEPIKQLVCVATMSQRYKGHHVLLDAMAINAHRGLDQHLTLVGDGRCRHDLAMQAKRLGIDGSVEFAGKLAAGEAVRQALDAADLFVLPSLTEGLPRAVIEAQARGLPCVGTDVGGIPELISANELVNANDASALANLLANLSWNAKRLTRLSHENLARARRYHASDVTRRRRQFYAQLKASEFQATTILGDRATTGVTVT